MGSGTWRYPVFILSDIILEAIWFNSEIRRIMQIHTTDNFQDKMYNLHSQFSDMEKQISTLINKVMDKLQLECKIDDESYELLLGTGFCIKKLVEIPHLDSAIIYSYDFQDSSPSKLRLDLVALPSFTIQTIRAVEIRFEDIYVSTLELIEFSMHRRGN